MEVGDYEYSELEDGKDEIIRYCLKKDEGILFNKYT